MGTYDYQINRGADEDLVWRFKNSDQSLFDLTNSRLILTICDHHGALLLRKDSDDDGGIDLVEATFTVPLTPVETRLIPLGKLASYELERWFDAEQKSMVHGFIEGIGGINND